MASSTSTGSVTCVVNDVGFEVGLALSAVVGLPEQNLGGELTGSLHVSTYLAESDEEVRLRALVGYRRVLELVDIGRVLG